MVLIDADIKAEDVGTTPKTASKAGRFRRPSTDTQSLSVM